NQHPKPTGLRRATPLLLFQHRTGHPLDLKANPINAVLCGPIGTRPSGWPSGRRGTGALPPVHLDMEEPIKPIEQHGFTIVDFSPDKMVLRHFKWDVKTQSVEAIDTLEPFHVTELVRPA